MLDFGWISDPTAWLGLGTLILLELVLGIDNLVFIAILADKLPPEQRARARFVGLSLALVMRLGLLFAVSWIAGLTEPIFSVLGLAISGRDLILIGGGVFLLFKATMELHERLEGAHASRGPGEYAAFWQVVAQIIVLDAVFSLDAVITAVGMVDELSVMMIAVIVAIVVMIAAAKPLMDFVSRHPTVVILCLGFLLMIGLTLILEGVDVDVPKGYLYGAIGFSIMIEAFNQLGRRNRRKREGGGDLRDRTAQAVLRMLGGTRRAPGGAEPDAAQSGTAASAGAVFAPEERAMVQGVITLGERPVRTIMTPRTDVAWIDLDAPLEATRRLIAEAGRSRFPVARGSLDGMVGVALTRDLLRDLLEGGEIDPARSIHPPVAVPQTLPVLAAMERMRRSPVQMVVVVDEYGSVQGVATPTDILEAIAGEFPEGAETALLLEQEADGAWLADGEVDIYRLGHQLGADLADQEGRYATLAGYLMARMGRLPNAGDRLEADGFEFEVVSLAGLRPGLVRVRGPAKASRGSEG